jgi:hypothetical protein
MQPSERESDAGVTSQGDGLGQMIGMSSLQDSWFASTGAA